MGQIDFKRITASALIDLPRVLRHWLPDGKVIGEEFTARNPTRADRKPGSFKINTRTGMWADFAVGATGGDPVSLVAYLKGCSQIEAARHLADALGIQAET